MPAVNGLGRLAVAVALGCACPSAPAAPGQACELRRIDVKPARGKSFESYVGKADGVEVRWTNPSPDHDVDLFDEPPLKWWDRRAGRRCQLPGGLWARDGIYFAPGRSVLALLTVSGSTSRLEFFRSGDCGRSAQIDVSGERPVVAKNRISFRGACEYEDAARASAWCAPAGVYTLDATCTPRHDDRESRALSIRIYGVAFGSYSRIRLPHTPDASVIETR